MKEPEKIERKEDGRFGAAPLLDDLRPSDRHFGDPSGFTVFRTINNTGIENAEMDDFPGVLPTIIRALKEEGVRCNKRSFADKDIVHLDKYVMIIRGKSGRLLDPLLHSTPCSISRK